MLACLGIGTPSLAYDFWIRQIERLKHAYTVNAAAMFFNTSVLLAFLPFSRFITANAQELQLSGLRSSSHIWCRWSNKDHSPVPPFVRQDGLACGRVGWVGSTHPQCNRHHPDYYISIFDFGIPTKKTLHSPWRHPKLGAHIPKKCIKTISTHVQKLKVSWSIGPHDRGKGTLDPMSMVLTVMPLCGMCLSCVFLGLFCPRQFFLGENWEQKSWRTRSIRVLYPSLRMQSKVYKLI